MSGLTRKEVEDNFQDDFDYFNINGFIGMAWKQDVKQEAMPLPSVEPTPRDTSGFMHFMTNPYVLVILITVSVFGAVDDVILNILRGNPKGVTVTELGLKVLAFVVVLLFWVAIIVHIYRVNFAPDKISYLYMGWGNDEVVVIFHIYNRKMEEIIYAMPLSHIHNITVKSSSEWHGINDERIQRDTMLVIDDVNGVSHDLFDMKWVSQKDQGYYLDIFKTLLFKERAIIIKNIQPKELIVPVNNQDFY